MSTTMVISPTSMPSTPAIRPNNQSIPQVSNPVKRSPNNLSQKHLNSPSGHQTERAIFFPGINLPAPPSPATAGPPRRTPRHPASRPTPRTARPSSPWPPGPRRSAGPAPCCVLSWRSRTRRCSRRRDVPAWRRNAALHHTVSPTYPDGYRRRQVPIRHFPASGELFYMKAGC